MIRHCNEVLAMQKGTFRRRSVGPTFFKSRMVSGAEASENPGLARETRYALFKRLCACSSFTVFTYVTPYGVRVRVDVTALAAPRRKIRGTRPYTRGRTPDTGQLQAHALYTRVFAYLV